MLTKIFEKYSLFLIVCTAFVIRIFDITNKDFWYDEAFTGIAVKEGFGEMLKMISNDVHPPFYYVSLKLFTFFFGNDVFGIRSFSLIFGVLGVLAIYFLAKEMFDRKAALWAALITAISPFAVQYSQEGRMYSLFSFLIVFATYWLVKGLKTDSKKFYVLWGVFWGLACLTHYLGILFAPLFYGVFLLDRLKNQPFKLDWKLFFGKGLAIGSFSALLVFTVWIEKFFDHLNRTSTLGWITPAKFSDIFLNFQMFLFGIPKGEYSGMPFPNGIYAFGDLTMFTLVVIFIAGVAFLVFYKAGRENKNLMQITVLCLGFLLVLYALSLIGKHYLVARYLIPSAYFLYIFLGVWISRISWKVATLSVGVYFVLIFGIQPVPIYSGFGQISKNIEKFEGSNFYVLNSFDYVIAKYYFGHERVILYNVDWPEYDSSMWAAIGKEKLRKTENFEDLKSDPDGLILYNTQVPWEARSDKSFGPEKFELVERYDNIYIFRSNPTVFFR